MKPMIVRVDRDTYFEDGAIEITRTVPHLVGDEPRCRTEVIARSEMTPELMAEIEAFEARKR
jgi:hypothetical protein